MRNRDFSKFRKWTVALILALVTFSTTFLLGAAAYYAFHPAHVDDGQESGERALDYMRCKSYTLMYAKVMERFTYEVERARESAAPAILPIFDDPHVAKWQSFPVMDLNRKRTTYSLDTCTSLLGNLHSWVERKTPPIESFGLEDGTRVESRLHSLSTEVGNCKAAGIEDCYHITYEYQIFRTDGDGETILDETEAPGSFILYEEADGLRPLKRRER